MMKLFLGLTSVLALMAGYYVYTPMPATIVAPWRTRAVAVVLDAAMAIARMVDKISGRPTASTFQQLTNTRYLAVKNYTGLQVEDKEFSGVDVRVYRPTSLKGLSPAVVYFHGGGWMIASIDAYDGLAARLARESNAVVIAVSYRKAPNHPYPAPFEDCVKATTYVLQHGSSIGVDSSKVIVAGDSAGGNLAAAVSLKLSKEDPKKIPPIRYQVLLCPALQATSFNTQSYIESPHGLISQERMIFFWLHYMGLEMTEGRRLIMARDAHVTDAVKKSVYGSYVKSKIVRSGKVNTEHEIKDDMALAKKIEKFILDPFMAPLMAPDVSKVAPALVVAMEFDQLRDDAILYAERLKGSGVKTDLWVIPDQTHPVLAVVSLPYEFGVKDLKEIFSRVSRHIRQVV